MTWVWDLSWFGGTTGVADKFLAGAGVRDACDNASFVSCAMIKRQFTPLSLHEIWLDRELAGCVQASHCCRTTKVCFFFERTNTCSLVNGTRSNTALHFCRCPSRRAAFADPGLQCRNAMLCPLAETPSRVRTMTPARFSGFRVSLLV